MNVNSSCQTNVLRFGLAFSLAVMISGLCNNQQCLAEDQAIAQADSVATSQPQDTAIPPASDTTLKGAVQSIQLNLEVLRDIGLDIKKLRSASEELYNEVTLQPVSLQMQPNVVGMGTIIYTPVAAAPVYMAPRKKRVDLAMNDMRPIVTLMKEDVDAVLSGQRKIDLPENTDEVLDPLLKIWENLVNRIFTQYSSLEPLTQTSNYDNKAIARIAHAIHKDTKTLEDTRKKVFKIIQKAGKEAQQK
jgi:hypothetical protein